MPEYKTLLFDWDGTLAQTLQIWLEEYRILFRKNNIDISDREIGQEVFGDPKGPIKFGIDPQQLPSLNRELHARVMQRVKQAPLFDQVQEMMQQLQSEKRSALVTTSTRELVNPALTFHNLSQKFDTIVPADDVTHHKPHPESLELALRRMGEEVSASVVMIGDSSSDLGAANALGVDSILFFPESHQLFYDKASLIDEFEPTHVVSSHVETLAIIQGT